MCVMINTEQAQIPEVSEFQTEGIATLKPQAATMRVIGKKYSTATAVYDVASNSLTSANNQNKIYYYILALQQHRLVVFPHNIVTLIMLYMILK